MINIRRYCARHDEYAIGTRSIVCFSAAICIHIFLLLCECCNFSIELFTHTKMFVVFIGLRHRFSSRIIAMIFNAMTWSFGHKKLMPRESLKRDRKPKNGTIAEVRYVVIWCGRKKVTCIFSLFETIVSHTS